jgi:hypothetical protein
MWCLPMGWRVAETHAVSLTLLLLLSCPSADTEEYVVPAEQLEGGCLTSFVSLTLLLLLLLLPIFHITCSC